MSERIRRAAGAVLRYLAVTACLIADHDPHDGKQSKTHCRRCLSQIERVGGQWFDRR